MVPFLVAFFPSEELRRNSNYISMFLAFTSIVRGSLSFIIILFQTVSKLTFPTCLITRQLIERTMAKVGEESEF